MKFQELVIELGGIRGTITQYTRNPYVIGYLDSLEKYVILQDANMTKTCISKILNWYSYNYEAIQSNENVFNKEDHKNTNQLLEETYNNIGTIQKRIFYSYHNTLMHSKQYIDVSFQRRAAYKSSEFQIS